MITGLSAVGFGTAITAQSQDGSAFNAAVITNSGSLSGGGGLFASGYANSGAGSSSITNTGSITSNDNVAIDAEAGGTSSATVTVTNSGALNSVGTGGIFVFLFTQGGAGVTSATVTNSGAITSSDAGFHISNTGDVSATTTVNNTGALISSTSVGLDINTSATAGAATIDVTNTGNITTSGQYYIDANLSGGTSGGISINTSGTLTGGTGLHAVASAVSGATISITNSGSITSSAIGITTDNTPTSIANNGQIVTTASGGTAISMGSGSNRLTIGGGSSITGFVTNGSTNAGTFSVANNNVLAFGGAGTGMFDLGQVALSPGQLGYALNGNIRSTNSPVNDTTHQYQGFSRFEKTGTSTITVTGTTANSGGWTVSGGQLNVAGTIGTVAVTNGGTLGGSGHVGNVTVASGGTIAGVQGQTLVVGGTLTLAAGSHTSVTLGGSNTAPLFSVSGVLTLNGALDVVSSTGTLANGVTRLFSYADAMIGSGLTLGTIQGSVNVPNAAIQTSVAGQINLVTSPTTASFWNGGNGGSGAIQGGNGTWNANTIWTNVSANNSSTIQPAAFAVFQGAAGQVAVSGSAGAVGIGGMQFVTSGYVLSGDPIALNGAQATIRVGDGTTAGAATKATVAAPLTGTAQLVKTDLGTLVLTGANTYSGGTQVTSGTLAISTGAALGTGAVSLNEGTTLAFVGNAVVGNALSFPQLGHPVIDTGPNTVTIAGNISGIGDLSKIGSGTLILTGANSYTGATDVVAGTLVVNGSTAASAAKVENGAVLGGSGTVGSLAVLAGGTAAPGVLAPFGTLNVAGNVTFAAGSTYQVQINAAGQTDRIAATGSAAIAGGTVGVTAGSGVYTPGATYTILTAAGGRTGTFSSLTTTSNLAFLTPTLGYTANSVTLGFSQSASFASVAGTPNERATANAIQGLGFGPLYAAVLSQSAAGARQAFNLASGEIHASAVTAGFEDTRIVREAILTRMFDAERQEGGAGLDAVTGALSPAPSVPGRVPVALAPRFALWGQAFGDFGANGRDGNAASLSRRTAGFTLGGDTRIDAAAFDAWRIGIVGGYTDDDLRVNQRFSSGTYRTAFGGVYASARYGAIGVRLGATAGGSWMDTRRSVFFSNFSQDAIAAHTTGTVVQGFGEIGYRVAGLRASLEPVLGTAAIHVGQDAFRESGGGASLIGFARGFDIQTVTPGLRAEMTPFADMPITARALLGYRHAFGDVAPKALLAFQAGSAPFTVAGAPIDRNAVVTEIGLDYRASAQLTLGLAYSGQYGARAESSAVKGRAEYRF